MNFLTTLALEDEKRRIMDSGVDYCLSKPIRLPRAEAYPRRGGQRAQEIKKPDAHGQSGLEN
ncbi:MAG: hypothetical protein ACO3ZW_07905 [Opitutales bacterium]